MSADARPTPVTTATSEVAAGVNELRALIAAWLLSKRSPHTRAAYQRDLGGWLVWLDEHDVPPLAARRAHVDAWIQTLAAQGVSPATVARRLSAVSSWYGYLVDEDVLARNPAGRVTRPEINPDHSDTQGLTVTQARALLTTATTDGPRSSAIVHLGLQVGLRVSEIASAAIEALGEQRGHRTLTVIRKGGGRQRLALPPATWHAVTSAVAGRDTGPIIATRTGRAMAESEIYRTVVRLARTAGVTARITPHSLRHTCATLALDTGASLRDVQDLLGHRDPRTTRRYDRARGLLDRSPAYAVAGLLTPPEPVDAPAT